MDPYVIEAITNPTQELCFAAVKKNGEVIRFIKDPLEAVCIATVTKFDYEKRSCQTQLKKQLMQQKKLKK